MGILVVSAVLKINYYCIIRYSTIQYSMREYNLVYYTTINKDNYNKVKQNKLQQALHDITGRSCTCTVLYFSVLYCIKKRKFADKQRSSVSKTEVHSTRERPTLQYIKLRYTIEAPNKYLYCSVLFRTLLYKN